MRTILEINRDHSSCLSTALLESHRNPALYASLVSHLAAECGLDSRLAEVAGRADQPLTRPELAVLLAYANMDLYRQILASPLPDEPIAAPYLEG